MTSRERIKRTLDFKIPDRVGIYDNIPEDFSDFDLALFELDKFDAEKYRKAKEKNLFLTLSFSCPFQKLVFDAGLEEALVLTAKEQPKAKDIFAETAESIIKRGQALFDEGFEFDGVWVWSDLAYRTGTYFSAQTYKKILYPEHKNLSAFFEKQGLPVILHCDGDCRDFIPLFLSAGVRALNPLETDCGFGDAQFVKKEYGKDLVLFGNMPALVLEKDKKEIEEVFKARLQVLKSGGGFIYHADKPIPETVSLENYRFALDIVKKYGAY